MLLPGQSRSRHLVGKRDRGASLENHAGLRVEKKVACGAPQHGIGKNFVRPRGTPACCSTDVLPIQAGAAAGRTRELAVEGLLRTHGGWEDVLIAFYGLSGELRPEFPYDPRIDHFLKGRGALLRHGVKE